MIDARAEQEKSLAAAKIGADIEKALAAAKQQYPDFAKYEQRMDQISKDVRSTPGMTPDEYIEKLYHLAKKSRA